MLALVPAEAAKQTQVGGKWLLKVKTGTILFGALERLGGDDGYCSDIAIGTSCDGLGVLRPVYASPILPTRREHIDTNRPGYAVSIVVVVRARLC